MAIPNRLQPLLPGNSEVFAVVSCSHIQVMLGEHDNGVWTGREQLRFAIETVVPDPTVRCENTCENDIMLIKLDSPAVYDNYVSPLDLATTCAPVGTPCTVMGWGLIESPGGKSQDVCHR